MCQLPLSFMVFIMWLFCFTVSFLFKYLGLSQKKPVSLLFLLLWLWNRVRSVLSPWALQSPVWVKHIYSKCEGYSGFFFSFLLVIVSAYWAPRILPPTFERPLQEPRKSERKGAPPPPLSPYYSYGVCIRTCCTSTQSLTVSPLHGQHCSCQWDRPETIFITTPYHGLVHFEQEINTQHQAVTTAAESSDGRESCHCPPQEAKLLSRGKETLIIGLFISQVMFCDEQTHYWQ